VALYLIILLAIGVVGKQSQKYYAHVLGSVGAWMVLMPTALWLSERMESPTWGFLNFVLMGLAWAVPVVIVANGYERRPMYRLFPRRAHTTEK
jgi:hypothetical protein